MIWFGWILCHINHCRLFNVKPVYTYIFDIYTLQVVGFMVYQPWLASPSYCLVLFVWVGVYGISTMVSLTIILFNFIFIG